MTIFLFGPNAYARKRQIDEMVKAYLAKGGSTLGLERIDGGSKRIDEILAAVAAAPFLATSRLVIIDNFSVNKSAGQIEQVLGAVPVSTVAVFTEGQVDMRTKVYRSLMTADKVVKFDILSGTKLEQWVRAEATRLGGMMDRAGAVALIAAAGEDQWRLALEINKLVNYRAAVTAQDVGALVVPTIEQSVFELVELMSAGNVARSLAGYRALIAKREPEMRVLVMVQWQLRNLLLAKESAHASPAELARVTKMSPYVAGKMMAAQSRIDGLRLRRAFLATAQCEYDIKTGALKADVAVEQLIYRVATAMA